MIFPVYFSILRSKASKIFGLVSSEESFTASALDSGKVSSQVKSDLPFSCIEQKNQLISALFSFGAAIEKV